MNALLKITDGRSFHPTAVAPKRVLPSLRRIKSTKSKQAGKAYRPGAVLPSGFVMAKDSTTPASTQIDWLHRLFLLNDEASDRTSDDRLVCARDFLYMAARQLKQLGEAKSDDTMLLIARVCESLEDAIGTIRVPQLIGDYETNNFEPPPALTATEIRKLNTALRQSSNAIEKAARSELRGVKVPTTKERAAAAIQCRDNIANFIARDTKPENLVDAGAALAANDLAMSIHVGFGSRFLLNAKKLTLTERRQLWLTESKRLLARAELKTIEDRRRAATRIVMACPVIDGMTEVQAKNLFKRDPNAPALSKREQTKRVRSRD